MTGRGQDAATEERLNKLAGSIEDLTTRLDQQRQENERLRREIAALQDQVNRPTPNYAMQEYVEKLAEAIRKIDQARLQDNKDTRARVDSQVEKLMREIAAIAATPPPAPVVIHRSTPTPPPAVDPTPPEKPRDETGFWYTIERGDTLSAIVLACKEKNLKVTKDQIIKANPKMKPELLVAKSKLWIPVEKP